MGSSFIRTTPPLWWILGALALAILVVGGCGEDERESSDRDLTVTETLAPRDSEELVGRRISDVLPPASEISATVIFVWTKGDSRFKLGPGTLVWRQSGGVLRIDHVHQGAANNPLTGTFIIEKGGSLDPTGASESKLECLWVRVQPSSTLTGANCDLFKDGLDPGPIPAIQQVVNSTISKAFPPRVIAGRESSCFETDTTALICLDNPTRLPLFISTAHPQTQQFQTIEAESVAFPSSQAALNIVPPPRGVDVDPAALGLPDMFELAPFEAPN